MDKKKIFISGGTGYIGRSLIKSLLGKDFEIYALVRAGSEKKLPEGCNIIIGDALNAETFRNKIFPCNTFVQLTGVSHPGPGKKQFFTTVDLASVKASVENAVSAGVKNFIYISVSNPAPVMKEYVDVRIEGERIIKESGMNAYIIRPWYVIGPGHYWPLIFKPVYFIAELIPGLKDKAVDLGLIKLSKVVNALVYAAENPRTGIRLITMKQLRNFK
ncbi:hypothetical protein BH10BAC5_BH10BAC5_09440 [soil metagenome]